MTKIILIRFTRMFTLMLALALLTFTLISLSPIDPVKAYFGSDSPATQAQVEVLEEKWGVNQPLYIQFSKWLSRIVRGDFGKSYLYRKPVSEILIKAFRNSFVLMMVSWILSGIIGYALGVISAFNRGKFIDRLIKLYCYALASIPSYVLGLVLLTVFGVWLSIFPVGLSEPIGIYSENVTFIQRLTHFALPCLTLSFLGVANVALHTREEMIKTLDSEFVMYSRSRGHSNRMIFLNHGLKNTLLPVVMIQFSYFSELFGGSALLEILFSYHGLGSVMTESGLKGDIPLLLGTIIISAIFVFTGNLIADIFSKVIDPRVKEGVQI